MGTLSHPRVTGSRAGRAAVLLLAAALLASIVGCGSDEADDSADVDASPTPGKAALKESGDPGAGLHPVSAALQRAASVSTYRYEWETTFARLPDDDPLVLTGSGAVDLASQRFSASVDVAAMFASLIGETDGEMDEQLRSLAGSGAVEVLVVDETLYMRWPGFGDLFGAGGEWVSVGLDDVGAGGGGGALLDQLRTPDEYLELLQQAGDFVDGGSDSVRGTPVTRWDGTVDLAALTRAQLESSSAEVDHLEELIEALEWLTDESDALPVSLWVDADGQLRRMQMGVTLAAGSLDSAPSGAWLGMTYELFALDEPVQLEPPPADRIMPLDSATLGPGRLSAGR